MSHDAKSGRLAVSPVAPGRPRLGVLGQGKSDANASDYARALVPDIRATPDWDATDPPDTWPLQWAADGLRQADEAYTGVVISRKRATADPTKPEWSLTLPPTYLDDATEWVETQLARGGYRLARLLDAIWP